MMIELLPEKGQFYKTNMHCHTHISDGWGTPEQVKEIYKRNGYSAVCFTDHEVLIDHRDLCEPDFIALHGYEVAVKQNLKAPTAWFQPVYHFNMIAKDQDNLVMPRFFKENPSYPGNSRAWSETHARYNEVIETTVYDVDWINEYTKAMVEGGFLVNYNHPMWSLHNPGDYLGLKHLHSIEVINGECQKWNDNTSFHYDQMLRAGHHLVPTGGDDNHKPEHCVRAWTMIKAEELSYESLIAAYERGDCYVSEGPEILSLVLKDGKVVVKTSPAAGIYLYSEGRYVDYVRSRTETYTEAEFDYCPEKMGRYLRIEVRDTAGYRAFSNAYYTADIAKKL
ncbi:MAG: hypothetical protein IIX65_02010 [Lachnospiraceae bacterium]|nr:hypothetical protein [Lachnospiraceae bacterium]